MLILLIEKEGILGVITVMLKEPFHPIETGQLSEAAMHEMLEPTYLASLDFHQH